MGRVKAFDAAGSATSPSSMATDVLFTGRVFDAETGLYYFRARYFEPDLGVFVSRDPLGFVDGDSVYQGWFDLSFNTDPSGMVYETPWDIASVIYDVGKITVGHVTKNPSLVADGWIDLGTDTVSVFVPGMPAGASKFARIGNRAIAKEIAENGTDLTLKLRMSRAKSVIAERNQIGNAPILGMKGIYDDIAAVNVRVGVKDCLGRSASAEFDIVMKNRTVFEIKNWQNINGNGASQIIDQINRQKEVSKSFQGRHGGLIIGDNTDLSKAAKELLDRHEVEVHNLSNWLHSNSAKIVSP